MITTSFDPAMVALLNALLQQRVVAKSYLIIDCAKLRGGSRRGNHSGLRSKRLAGCPRGRHHAMAEHARVSCGVRRTFSSRASRAGDFGALLRASVLIIFLLTSFCVDSIHQSVATKHRC